MYATPNVLYLRSRSVWDATCDEERILEKVLFFFSETRVGTEEGVTIAHPTYSGVLEYTSTVAEFWLTEEGRNATALPSNSRWFYGFIQLCRILIIGEFAALLL